jgi:hypothetical protein
MKQRPRIYYSDTQKALVWDRWQKATLSTLSRAFMTEGILLFPACCRQPVAYDLPEENVRELRGGSLLNPEDRLT